MLTFSFASTSAPFASSASTTSKQPPEEATWSGVCPSCHASFCVGEHRNQHLHPHIHTRARTLARMHALSLTLPIAHTHMHASDAHYIHRYAHARTHAHIHIRTVARVSERDEQRVQARVMLTSSFVCTSAPFASSAPATFQWQLIQARRSGVSPFCGAGEHCGQRLPRPSFRGPPESSLPAPAHLGKHSDKASCASVTRLSHVASAPLHTRVTVSASPRSTPTRCRPTLLHSNIRQPHN
jgi:hypothetical protein